MPAMFQFPSNGKVDSEVYITGTAEYEQSFNSLQTGKWIQRMPGNPRKRAPKRFNSLQTGKWIQRTRLALQEAIGLSFNSLQTGKWIQSVLTSHRSRTPLQVSIPFKRESGFRDTCISRNNNDNHVSIPFKRESGFRGSYPRGNNRRRGRFNSLQTGKWIQSKIANSLRQRTLKVSIPFKRESGFRDR